MNTLENPLGTNGFAFIEFTTSKPSDIENYFLKLGLTHVANHKNAAIKLFRQGEINFLLNATSNSHASRFAQQHGAGVVAIAFRVRDALFTKKHALCLGAKEYVGEKTGLSLATIEGVGNSLIYFINDNEFNQFFDEQFDFLENVDRQPKGVGLLEIDHLTHNVKRGDMDVWANFYEKIFNFHQIKYFSIKGKMTGLESRAMTSPCGKIRIPINESADDKSQIAEFIDEFHGAGIQHIALSSENIYQSISKLRQQGIQFLDTPAVYFDMIQERLPWQQENIAKLRELKILIDGEKTPDKGLLLQIFTENMLGPVFFEIIQRKGNEGFGEGNFQALFEAIERDQIMRGKL